MKGISSLKGIYKVKAGLISRDTNTASGNQSITGVGFRPKAVFFFMARDDSGTWRNSVGVDIQSSRSCLNDTGALVSNTFNVDNDSSSIVDIQGAGVTYKGYISSMDSDGFTITWTKQGSCSGTIRTFYLAMR